MVQTQRGPCQVTGTGTQTTNDYMRGDLTMNKYAALNNLLNLKAAVRPLIDTLRDHAFNTYNSELYDILFEIQAIDIDMMNMVGRV